LEAPNVWGDLAQPPWSQFGQLEFFSGTWRPLSENAATTKEQMFRDFQELARLVLFLMSDAGWISV
jgi:hypothetical protein